MFTSIKRLLIAGTVILAVGVPSAASAFVQDAPGGSSTSGQARPSIAQLPTAPQVRRLDQLQATVAQRFASEGGWPGVSAVQSIGPSSQAGFQWGDAGIGAAAVLALVGVGAGATVVIRRRARQPLAS